MFYEFAESYAHELLADATEELWTPVTLCAAENAVWTEVAGLFREDMDDDFTQTPPSYNIAGLFRASYYLASGESSQLYNFTNPVHSAAERRRSDCISIRGAEADIKDVGRKINGVRVDALIQLLHPRGRLAESYLLKSNRYPRTGCWLAGPGGRFLAGSTNLNLA